MKPFKKNMGLSVPQIGDISGLKKTSVENAIKALRKKELVKRGKHGYYISGEDV